MQLQLQWTWGLAMAPPPAHPDWELSGGPVRIRLCFRKEAVHGWEDGEGKSTERDRDRGLQIEDAMGEEEKDLRNTKK